MRTKGDKLPFIFDGDIPDNAITGRSSHARTRANIEKAVQLGVPLRVATDDAQRVTEARANAKHSAPPALPRPRPSGRAAHDQHLDPSELPGKLLPRHRDRVTGRGHITVRALSLDVGE
ncbi:hypothetical protein [Actinomadura rubteroloni]|uniref:hypothetical protein n=1 Tax=Actinomadura rubteroloni TaxID=1926885 RepID=UPI0011B07365|nr:hypothetical protein [Actinomadura rubteroloni]